MSHGAFAGVTRNTVRLFAVLSATSVVSSIGGWGVGTRWNPSSPPQDPRPGDRTRSSLPFLILFIAVCIGCLFCLKVICGRCNSGNNEEEEETRRERERRRRPQPQEGEERDEQQPQQQQQSDPQAGIPTVSGSVPEVNAEGVNFFLSQRGEFTSPINYGGYPGEHLMK